MRNNDGIEKMLIDAAYDFYPKNVCAENNREIYLKSSENYSLLYLLDKAIKEVKGNAFKVKIALEQEFGLQIIDHTLFKWMDRCHNYQIIMASEGNKHEVLCVNLSVLQNVFTVYCLETEVYIENGSKKYKLFRNAKLEKTKFKDEIQNINSIIKKFKYQFIEIDILLNFKFKDINFQDIPMGYFSLFNAFFVNDFNSRIY